MPGTLLLVNPSPPRRRLYGSRGMSRAMYGRPVSLSPHRPTRSPVKVKVGGKRALPKTQTKGSKTMRMGTARRARRNPFDKSTGTYYRKVKGKRKDYSPATLNKLVRKTTRRPKRAADGTIIPPSDAQMDRAFRAMYGRKRTVKRPAAKKRTAGKKSAAAAKRSAAAKKAARTRKRNQALKAQKRKAAAKKRKSPVKSKARKSTARKSTARKSSKRRAAPRRRQRSMAVIVRRLADAQRGVRRSKAKRSRTRAIHRTRASALRLQKAQRRGQLSPGQRRLMRRHGLTRVNPSLGGAMSAFMDALPNVGIGLVATAGAAVLGQKLGDMLKKPEWIPAAAKPFMVPVATTGVTLGAFIAASMSSSAKVQSLRQPILIGGMAAVLVHLLSSIKGGQNEAGQEISLGRKLGLPIALQSPAPIGSYVAIGEYIPQSLGRHYGEQLGRYVSIGAAPNPYLQVDGAEVRLNGYGQETFPEFGIFGEMQPIYNKEGEIVEHELLPTGTYQDEWSQLGYGREPARAVGAEGDATVEEVLDEDSGVLSGSIFD